MAFFPEQYKVFPDTQGGKIILSARISEDVAESYFLTKDQCTPFVEATSFSEWSGSDAIMAKVSNNEATLALRTSEGTKYYRSDVGTLLVMQAQMRSILPSIASSTPTDSPLSETPEILFSLADIQMIVRRELSIFKSELLADLAPIVREKPSPKTMPRSIAAPNSIFIPSKITNNDLQGEIKIKSSHEESNIDNALEALKKLRKQGDKK